MAAKSVAEMVDTMAGKWVVAMADLSVESLAVSTVV